MGKALPEMPKSAGSNVYLRLSDLKDTPLNSDDIRVLSEFIVGYEGWVDNGKKGEPLRKPSMNDFDPATKWMVQDGKPRTPKPFAACFVWRYSAKRVQVALFTQVTITDVITGLENNAKWGDVRDYDLTITRSDKDGKVSYSVTPNPKEPVSAEAKAAWDEVQANSVGLEALFYNGDPFAPFDQTIPF